MQKYNEFLQAEELTLIELVLPIFIYHYCSNSNCFSIISNLVSTLESTFWYIM